MAKTFKQFRLDNVTATLPTTLEYGEEVYYTDANGNLTLWVGHSDGSAWPVCGYKEYSALVSQSNETAPTVTILSNTVGTVSITRNSAGSYQFANAGFVATKTLVQLGPNNTPSLLPLDADYFEAYATSAGGAVTIYTVLNGETPYENPSGANVLLSNRPVSIRVYP